MDFPSEWSDINDLYHCTYLFIRFRCVSSWLTLVFITSTLLYIVYIIYIYLLYLFIVQLCICIPLYLHRFTRIKICNSLIVVRQLLTNQHVVIFISTLLSGEEQQNSKLHFIELLFVFFLQVFNLSYLYRTMTYYKYIIFSRTDFELFWIPPPFLFLLNMKYNLSNM